MMKPILPQASWYKQEINSYTSGHKNITKFLSLSHQIKTQNTSNIKETNVSYIHLRKMNKTRLFSNLLISAQGVGWLKPIPAAQGTRQEPHLERMLFHCQDHSHTSTLTQTGATQTRQFTQHAHLWDVGGNWSTLRKTKLSRRKEMIKIRDEINDIDS